jgi:hypothetical protein
MIIDEETEKDNLFAVACTAWRLYYSVQVLL